MSGKDVFFTVTIHKPGGSVSAQADILLSCMCGPISKNTNLLLNPGKNFRGLSSECIPILCIAIYPLSAMQMVDRLIYCIVLSACQKVRTST